MKDDIYYKTPKKAFKKMQNTHIYILNIAYLSISKITDF